MNNRIVITLLDQVRYPVIDGMLSAHCWFMLGLNTKGKKTVIVYEDRYMNLILETK